jgi:uncharacterized iron-regulated membrane protein
MWNTFIHRPHQVWLRKALFQIHLWGGVILALYLIVIGVTGSLLVFQDELIMLSYPQLVRSAKVDRPWAEPGVVVERMRARYPRHQLQFIYSPRVRTENYVAIAVHGNSTRYIFADPHTGAVTAELDPATSWIVIVQMLHIYLLSGQTGLIVNGVGGGCLVALCLTGLVLWWPGIRTWTRALRIDFSRGWKRINFDLHSALGFWTLLFTSIWGVTAIYFAWPVPVANLIRSVLPAQPDLGEIQASKRPPNAPFVPLETLIDDARRATPAGRVLGVGLAHEERDPVMVIIGRGAMNNFGYSDFFYYDPVSGKRIAEQRSGFDGQAGDIVIALLGPIHFGTQWGLAVKIAWALMGLSLPILAVTGCLMYWNRWLGKRWKRWRRKRPAAREDQFQGT